MILRKVDLGALIGTDIAELAMRIVAALLILVVGLWLVKLLVNLAKKTVFYKKQTTELQSFFASALKALGHGHHQTVSTQIRLTMLFATKYGEALYSQQREDLKLTVAQIMSTLLRNSGLKNVWKTTRSFRYYLKQIPYYYTVEVTDSRD